MKKIKLLFEVSSPFGLSTRKQSVSQVNVEILEEVKSKNIKVLKEVPPPIGLLPSPDKETIDKLTIAEPIKLNDLMLSSSYQIMPIDNSQDYNEKNKENEKEEEKVI